MWFRAPSTLRTAALCCFWEALQQCSGDPGESGKTWKEWQEQQENWGWGWGRGDNKEGKQERKEEGTPVFVEHAFVCLFHLPLDLSRLAWACRIRNAQLYHEKTFPWVKPPGLQCLVAMWFLTSDFTFLGLRFLKCRNTRPGLIKLSGLPWL